MSIGLIEICRPYQPCAGTTVVDPTQTQTNCESPHFFLHASTETHAAIYCGYLVGPFLISSLPGAAFFGLLHQISILGPPLSNCSSRCSVGNCDLLSLQNHTTCRRSRAAVRKTHNLLRRLQAPSLAFQHLSSKPCRFTGHPVHFYCRSSIHWKVQQSPASPSRRQQLSSDAGVDLSL